MKKVIPINICKQIVTLMSGQNVVTHLQIFPQNVTHIHLCHIKYIRIK